MSVFQEISEDRILHRGKHYFLIYDGYPVSDGHILIITNKLKKDFFELDDSERNELPIMIGKAKIDLTTFCPHDNPELSCVGLRLGLHPF